MKPKLPNLLRLMPWISVLVMALLSWYFLVMRNADVLFMQQLHSLFNDSSEFFQQYQVKPAGFLRWAGCYFTQLFYYPASGSSVLILMWALIFFLMKKALRVTDAFTPLLIIPLVCLLVSEIDLGYWIYYNKNAGYCFSQTIGLLGASFLVYLFRAASGVKFRFSDTVVAVIGAGLLVFLYRFIGVYAMAASATLAVIMLLGRKWIAGGLYVVAAAATPFLFQQAYDTLRSDQFALAGLPVFEAGSVTTQSLTLPFEIAIALLIAFSFLHKVADRIRSEKASLIFSSLLLVVVTGCSFGVLEDNDYDDENYHAECKSYRYLDEMKYEEALEPIRAIKGTLTHQLIMMKNVALFNTGDIGNSMFDFDDKGMIPTTRDSLKVNMANTAASIIYLHHGMTNFAYHWCMELQVEYGFNISQLRIMSLCAIITGESKLAEKYLTILSRTMFYKDWAAHYMPLARNPKLIGKYPELAHINDLHSRMSNFSDSDGGICENYIIRYFANTMNKDSKYLQEMTLVYTIIIKDIKKFWPHYLLYLHLHKGEKIPEIYQQAAYMYMDLEPQSAPDAKTYGLEFDKERIMDRYNQFDQLTQNLLKNGFSEESIARQTEAEFGNTFWWVYYFNKGAICY